MALERTLTADWLKPIYKRIRTGVLGGGYVQIDETPIEYLSPGHGETKLGYFWTCARPQGDCFFQWQTSRAASCIEDLIPTGWKGEVHLLPSPFHGTSATAYFLLTFQCKCQTARPDPFSAAPHR